MIEHWLQRIWYARSKPPVYLRAVAWLYSVYISRLPSIEFTRKPKIVIVVGNVVAGGSGKTPLVTYLANLAMQQDIKVAVVARIYKGNENGPVQVTEDTRVSAVGDEPKLLAKRLTCPVIVSRKRSQSIDYIIKKNIECDVIISDDGLQHPALPRAVELGILDGQRGIGNGYLLPAGPLREPVERLNRCQWIIHKGGDSTEATIHMQLTIEYAVNLSTGERRPLQSFSDQAVTAIAGIAHPSSFFASLQQYGMFIDARPFPDHYHYKYKDLHPLNGDKPLLMTEKDAVKCLNMQLDNAWYVPLQVNLPASFDQAFIARCQALVGA